MCNNFVIFYHFKGLCIQARVCFLKNNTHFGALEVWFAHPCTYHPIQVLKWSYKGQAVSLLCSRPTGQYFELWLLAQDCFEVVNFVLHCFTSQRHLNDYTVPLQWATNAHLFHLFQSPHSLAPLDPFRALSSWKEIGVPLGVSWHRKLTLPFGFKAPNWWEQKLMFQSHLLFVFLSHSNLYMPASWRRLVSLKRWALKMLSVNVLALELIASFFKATGIRQKGKQVTSQQSWNIFYQLHCLCTFDKINGLANDLAVLAPFYMIFWILILLFAWVGCFAILQVSLLLFIILNI